MNNIDNFKNNRILSAFRIYFEQDTHTREDVYKIWAQNYLTGSTINGTTLIVEVYTFFLQKALRSVQKYRELGLNLCEHWG